MNHLAARAVEWHDRNIDTGLDHNHIRASLANRRRCAEAECRLHPSLTGRHVGPLSFALPLGAHKAIVGCRDGDIAFVDMPACMMEGRGS